MSDPVKPQPADDRPVYAPPLVTRLSDVHIGKGAACVAPGSSATDDCTGNGNLAKGPCNLDGADPYNPG